MRGFREGAEIGITHEDLREILQDWLNSGHCLDITGGIHGGFAHDVSEVRLSPKNKYVVRCKLERKTKKC